MTDLNDLIARLESAAEGSRELSDAVLLACGWMEGPLNTTIWYRPDFSVVGESDNPSPTESVDDALALVPEGVDWEVGGGTDSYSYAEVGPYLVSLEHSTPALALSAAILRAADTGDYSYSFPAEEDDKLEE